MSLLQVSDVAKRFGGVVALDGVSLAIDEGEVIGLVGPNGSGKSTLINILSGFYSSDHGAFSFAGIQATGLSSYRIVSLGVARTHQIPRPFNTMTPRENIAVSYMFGSRKHTLTQARSAADQWLEFTELVEVADVRVGELTLHQLKFLELARALATEPRLLLLDEVLAGLNPTEIDRSVEMIRRIHAHGVTLLVVEHVVRAVMALSHRIVVLDQGKVIAEGNPTDVMADEAVVAAYLGDRRRHA